MRQLVVLEPSRLVREGISRLLAERGYKIVEQSAVTDPDQSPVADENIDLVLTEVPGPRYCMEEWLHRIAAFYPRAKIVLLTSHCEDSATLRAALTSGAFGYIEKDLSADAVHAIIDAVLHGQIVYPRELRDCLTARPAAADPVQPRAAQRSQPKAISSPLVNNVVDLRQQVAVPTQTPPDVRAPDRNLPVDLHSVGRGSTETPPEPDCGLSSREHEILQHVAKGRANKIIAKELNISEATVKSHLKSLLRKLNFQNRTQAAIWAVNRYNTLGDSLGSSVRVN